MAALRYWPPLAFLALAPIGATMGGGWALAPVAAVPLAMVGLDAALGDEPALENAPEGRAGRLLPAVYVVLQLCVIAWAASRAARPGLAPAELLGLALSCGLTLGVFGFVAAHEMIHSDRAGERALGLALLAPAFYMHFRIAHVHGHHRRAATREDPASARLGESLYAFLPRSIAGQFREAWAFEARRLRRGGRRVIGPGNRMLAYLAIEGLLLVGVGLFSARAMAFLLASAVMAVFLLETFNYVAHYGLTRSLEPGGRVERLGPQHAWNSARWMNNRSLFNMGRHSDHHRLTTRPYQRLEAAPGAPELPAGYAGMVLLAIAPPLWRRVMDPRAAAVRAAQGEHDLALREPG